MKKVIIGSLVAAALAVALPASAGSRVGIYVNVAPPVAPYEFVPAPRVGYVWAPGYWDWRYGRYHWIAGHWVRNHAAYHRAGWYDADRDGVPNRYDRAPFNPYRR